MKQFVPVKKNGVCVKELKFCTLAFMNGIFNTYVISKPKVAWIQLTTEIQENDTYY